MTIMTQKLRALQAAGKRATVLPLVLSVPPVPIVERMLRFRVEKVEDGVTSLTTAVTLYTVFEATHHIAIEADGTVVCRTHSDQEQCREAINVAASTHLRDALTEDHSA